MDKFVFVELFAVLKVFPTNLAVLRLPMPTSLLGFKSLNDACLVMDSQMHNVQHFSACGALHQQIPVVVIVVHVLHQIFYRVTVTPAFWTLELSTKVNLSPVIGEFSPKFERPFTIGANEQLPFFIVVTLGTFVIITVFSRPRQCQDIVIRGYA